MKGQYESISKAQICDWTKRTGSKTLLFKILCRNLNRYSEIKKDQNPRDEDKNLEIYKEREKGMTKEEFCLLWTHNNSNSISTFIL